MPSIAAAIAAAIEAELSRAQRSFHVEWLEIWGCTVPAEYSAPEIESFWRQEYEKRCASRLDGDYYEAHDAHAGYVEGLQAALKIVRSEPPSPHGYVALAADVD